MKRFVILIIVVGIGFGLWYWLQAAGYLSTPEFSSDPQVAEVQRMQKALVAKSTAKPGSMPDEQQMQAMVEKIRALTDEQRRAFFESSRDVMRGMMEARMKRFFTLSPEEQKKQLDEDIDRIEKAKKEGRGFGPFGGGPRDENRQAAKQAGNGGQASGGTNKGAPRRDLASLSPEERNERRRQMLSHTSPEQRAMFTAYKSRLDARMVERGLQPTRFP